MRIHIDRDLPVPIPLQLQGQIEYGVTIGDFPPGSRLPSVRELAAELGVSPVTVSTVYRTLQAAGLIDSAPGRGTFVRSEGVREPTEVADPTDAALRRALQRADRAGVGRAELIERLQRLVAQASPAVPLRAAFVGVYPHVTRAYVADLRRHLAVGDELVATTFDELADGGGALAGRDVLFTFAHRMADLERLAHANPVVASVALIPSERTRVALAEIDPLARVVLVSAVPEFVVTFRSAFERFASHVASVRTTVHAAPGGRALVDAVGDADVVVYATGAEDVLDGLPADVRAFEYRHVPDPVQVETVLLPLVERLRAAKARGEPPREAR
ncbi:MAG: GntR family transcriptional regulator [Trueperaceae bacterium]|nr:GntR family transcriptional regulator [Trueperaceae bacterium]